MELDSLAIAIKRKSFKLHAIIKVPVQINLDSIADIISKGMQNTNISGSEFYKVLQEVKKYCKLKANIRNQSKTKIKQITKEQREELLKQGRERSKNLFYQKLQLLYVFRVSMPHKV